MQVTLGRPRARGEAARREGTTKKAVESDAAQLVKGDAAHGGGDRARGRAAAPSSRPMDSSCGSGCSAPRSSADEVNELVAEQVARGVPYKFGRAALRTRLVNFVYRRMGLLEADPRDITRAIQADPVVRGALDAVWPSVSPAALVARPAVECRAARRVRRRGARPRRAGRRIRRRAAARAVDGRRPRAGRRSARSARGAHAHLRPRDRRRGPGPLADAAADDRPARAQRARSPCSATSRRPPRAWTHTLVGRRGRAPATAAPRRTARSGELADRELTLGYRVPGLVLDFAAQLLPEAAPMVAADGIGSRRAAPAAAHPSPTPTCSRPRSRKPPRSPPRASSSAASWRARARRRRRRARSPRRASRSASPERDGILKPITVLPARTRRASSSTRSWWWNRPRSRARPRVASACSTSRSPARSSTSTVVHAAQPLPDRRCECVTPGPAQALTTSGSVRRDHGARDRGARRRRAGRRRTPGSTGLNVQKSQSRPGCGRKSSRSHAVAIADAIATVLRSTPMID